MNCDLLINAFGYDNFEKMCHIVGVSAKEVIKNKFNTGGAQYIIKDIPADFGIMLSMKVMSYTIICIIYCLRIQIITFLEIIQ